MEQSFDIRQVDFRNFTYRADSSCLDDSKPIQVSDGEYKEYRTGTNSLGFFLKVDDVVYGDITGDGRDEAVVRMSCDAGGYVNEALVYTFQNGNPKLLTTLDSGHRAFGGIASIEINKGLLEIERYQSNIDAATPEQIYTETLHWNGNSLIEAGKPARRKYIKSEN